MFWQFGKCCLIMKKYGKNISVHIWGQQGGSLLGKNAYFYYLGENIYVNKSSYNHPTESILGTKWPF